MANIVDISELLLMVGLGATQTDEERAIAQVALTLAEGAVKRFLHYDPVQRERTEFYPQHDYRQTNNGYWDTDGSRAVFIWDNDSSANVLHVQHVPIRSISQLYIDVDGRSGTRGGSFAASTLKTEGTDFWPNYNATDSSGNPVCMDGMIRSHGRWPSEAGTVKMIYTAGYTSDELHGRDTHIDASPIVDAVLSEAARRFRRAFIEAKKSGIGFAAGPIVEEALGSYRYRLGQGPGTSTERLFGGLYDLLPESKEKLTNFVNYGWVLAP